MNIILIGFMGSGKTTIAKRLAKKLICNYLDMDDLILKKSKRSNINQIFALDGELKFRELEISVAKKLSKTDNLIISTGGGVVMNRIIIDYLKSSGMIVFLESSFENIKKRLKFDDSRPLFKNPKIAQELFELRQPLYQQYSDLTIKTDQKSLREITNIIIEEKIKHEN